MLKKLNELNDVNIYDVYSDNFLTFGKIVDGFDFSEITDFMNNKTSVPKTGNIYVPSVETMEQTQICNQLQNILYGGMQIQIGYCNGMNTTYNGFEYHKCSEINVAVTDFMLVLGHTYEIENNTFSINKATVFYVPKGTAFEMFQTTLHLSPLRTHDSGFKNIIILLKGTNTPLKNKQDTVNCENRLLLQTNKWVIAHPNREQLIKQGAFAGVIGENKELFYK